MRIYCLGAAIIGVAVVLSGGAQAQKQYGPGASDTEIKIGQTGPYSGPLSSLGIVGRVMGAYLKMINEKGGINARKVTLISVADAFSPPKTVEQTRKLVEGDEVLAMVGSVGTPTNLAVAKYLNGKKVPQLLLVAGSPKLDDPTGLPWTTTFYASQSVEARIYAQHLLASNPNAKVAVLYQNDDFGKGYLAAFKAGLGEKAATMIVKEVSHETTEPTIDSQIVGLKVSGADTLFQATNAKFAAQAIRKSYEIGWKVQHILVSAVTQIPTVLRPAGLEASIGAVSSLWHKQPGDPTWDDDAAMKDYLAFMKQWAPAEPADDWSAAFAYSLSQFLVEILKNCGDDLTRENVLKQATNVKDLQLPLFVSGVRMNISPANRLAWRQARMARFDGRKWVFFGDIVSIPPEN
jgi:branched-chain amino acid transport system substrate-binding protein